MELLQHETGQDASSAEPQPSHEPQHGCEPSSLDPPTGTGESNASTQDPSRSDQDPPSADQGPAQASSEITVPQAVCPLTDGLSPAITQPVAGDPGDCELSHLTDAERRRYNWLNQQRQHTAKLAGQEAEKFDLAVSRIDEAREAIAKATQDLRNARTRLQVLFEQRDNAERHRGEHEAELCEINGEIADLERTPRERTKLAARRERERLKAEVDAAAQAAREAFENELIEVRRPHERVPDSRGRTVGWANVAACNQIVKIKRCQLPQHETDMAEANAWFAKLQRDDLADEYESELRLNGRQTIFKNRADRVGYFSQWGADSPRGRAYRERQRERGHSEADPVRIARR
jgi:hypothetical protein